MISQAETTIHRQVWVKVNARADEAMAPLVAALSELDERLQTIESCQGTQDRDAWLCFRFGESWRDLAEFVMNRLGPILVGELGDRIRLGLYFDSWGEIRGELSMPLEIIPSVLLALRRLA